MARDPIVLNQPFKRRQAKSGAVRYSIEMSAEPLVFDPASASKQLASAAAESIAEELRKQVRAISATAAPATLKARARAPAALARGVPSAVKRYSGGKTGASVPNQSQRMFNDSGRFAKSIVAMARAGGYTINVAANRLTDDVMPRMFARLAELVPAFRSPGELMKAGEVRGAVQRALDASLVKLRETKDEVSAARARAVAQVALQALLRVAFAA